MERRQLKQKFTHILLLDGETFPIYHKERRLYCFIDWKESRDKLIKIMLAKIKNETGENTAFIDFKMANPMRKSRLGNFFIDLVADIKVKGKSLGTLEELGMKNILIDSFETLDLDELDMRSKKEALYSEVQYEEELNIRINKLITIEEPNLKDLKYSMESLKDLVMKSMEKDGWSTTSDNRFLARRRRQSLSNN
jgi:hypothetical protein